MAGDAEISWARRWSRWRILLWGTASLILLLPLLAMQYTQEVAWDLSDFALLGAMLAGACGTYELSARMSGHLAYRAAVGVALATACVLVWMNFAVGLIGSESNPANMMYDGVLAVGVIGAIIARFQPRGMARPFVAVALAQILVAVISLIAGWGSAVTLTGFFVALWLTSASLFQKATQGQTSTSTTPQVVRGGIQ